MNTILVPTDFSSNALSAAQYAAKMAAAYDWSICLLHAYTPLTSSLAGQEFNEQVTVHAIENANAQMEELLVLMRQEFPDLEINHECVQGFLIDILPRYIQKKNIQLVVMGTKGASGLKNVILGSNTFDIIQKSPIGVLAVPQHYSGFKLERVGLLSNFKESEIDLLLAFTAKTRHDIEIVMLHVCEPNSHTEESDLLYWKKYLQEKTKLEHISCRMDKAVNRLDVNESIPQCIDNMIKQEAIDLLLVSYNEKSFFEQLFSRNLAKRIAHHLVVPAFFYKER